MLLRICTLQLEQEINGFMLFRAKISEETGLSRTSLCKALSDGSKPQFANNHEGFESDWTANSGESGLCLKLEESQLALHSRHRLPVR